MNAIAKIPSPITVPNRFDQCAVPRDCPVLIDFSLGSNYSLDLSQVQAQGFIDCVQCVYIDNSASAFPITILTSPNTNQRIIIPAGAQGYVPVVQTNPPVLGFSTSYTGQITVQLLNFYVAPCIWPSAGWATASGGTVTVVPGVTALTDRSGTIAIGGTAQPLSAANASRKFLLIQNPPTATEVLTVMFGASGAGPVTLTAGMSYVADGITVPSSGVWVNGATGGHAFTAYEG